MNETTKKQSVQLGVKRSRVAEDIANIIEGCDMLSQFHIEKGRTGGYTLILEVDNLRVEYTEKKRANMEKFLHLLKGNGIGDGDIQGLAEELACISF